MTQELIHAFILKIRFISMLDIGYTDLNFPNHKKHPDINKN